MQKRQSNELDVLWKGGQKFEHCSIKKAAFSGAAFIIYYCEKLFNNNSFSINAFVRRNLDEIDT